MRIIIFSGHAGAGKDTSASIMGEMLVRKGYHTLMVSFADLLKFTLTEFLGWDGKKDAHGRELLQRIGTDCVRKTDPDYWVNYIIFMLNTLPETWDYVLIPDARFPNEIERIREEFSDVTHIRVTSGTLAPAVTESQSRHSSETSLDGYPYDMLIRNDGTRAELEKTVENLLYFNFGVE